MTVVTAILNTKLKLEERGYNPDTIIMSPKTYEILAHALDKYTVEISAKTRYLTLCGLDIHCIPLPQDIAIVADSRHIGLSAMETIQF